jgi:hypothetical protein
MTGGPDPKGTGGSRSTMNAVRVRPIIYGTFRRSSDRVLVLTDESGAHELPITLSAADASLVETALVGSEILDGIPPELTFPFGTGPGTRIEKTTVRKIEDDPNDAAYVATVSVVGREARSVAATDVAFVIAAALAHNAPILVAHDLFASCASGPDDYRCG